jgi:SAM-dependent methyltransferase
VKLGVKHSAWSGRWFHRVPNARLVERKAFLESVASGKRVIHVGFAGRGEDQHAGGSWLHARLATTAASLVGVDNDEETVEKARAEGWEAYTADCQDPRSLEALGIEPADVVIAAEIIEHLDSPGRFFDALHHLVRPDGVLVITTPNAYSLLNPIAGIAGLEMIDPDHVSLYSWYTLQNLLQQRGWAVSESLGYYYLVRGRAPSFYVIVTRILLAGQRVIARWRPFLGNGLIAVARHDGNGHNSDGENRDDHNSDG